MNKTAIHATALAVLIAVGPVAADDVRYASDRDAMTKSLSQQPYATKGLQVPSGERVEVMRQKGLNVHATRSWEPVERQPAARINLKIEFDFDSATVRPTSHELLSELGASLNDPAIRDIRVVVNGHTDSVGSDEYNLVLSFRRAHAVRDYLVHRLGIAPERVEIAGFGESIPLVDNDTPFNRQINRRVEVERL